MTTIRKGVRTGDDDDTPINPQQYGSTGSNLLTQGF